jgi:hypothetical protein
MSNPQVAAVIPQLSVEQLLPYLKTQTFARHLDYLAHASALQKECYLQTDLAANKELTTWADKKQALETLIADFKAAPSAEKLEKLQAKWVLHSSSIKMGIEQQARIFQALKKINSLFDHQKVLSEVALQQMAITGRVTAIAAELEKMSLEIDKLAQLVETLEIIPSEFIDEITGALMDLPVQDRHGNILDENTWLQSGSNPYTRETLDASQLRVAEELKVRLDAYRKTHP